MPTYPYVSDDGEYLEEVHAMGKAPSKVVRDGKVFHRDYQTVSSTMRVRVKNGTGIKRKPCSTWPRESEACGVAPQDVPRAMAEDRRLGVPTDYSREGNPIFSGKQHEKKWLKAHGYHHRNAGYSDATPD